MEIVNYKSSAFLHRAADRCTLAAFRGVAGRLIVRNHLPNQSSS